MDTEKDNETPEATPSTSPHPTPTEPEAPTEPVAEAAPDVETDAEEEEEYPSNVEVVDPAALRAQVAALTAQLEGVRAERDELTSRLRTVSAAYKQQQDDVSATRKRLERLAAEKEVLRRGEVVSALFEPFQNLRRSKDAMERVGVEASHTTGLDMVIRQVAAAFENLGMEEVPGKGARFDPNLHEALTTMPVQDPALDNVVIEVYETGYRLGGRLIRAARVVIGDYTPPAPPPAAEEKEDDTVGAPLSALETETPTSDEDSSDSSDKGEA